MQIKFKDIFKYSKLPLIMSIVTLLIGILLFNSTAIGIPNKEKLIILLISFVPFLIFLLITILSYYFKEKYKKILKTITIILKSLLLFYYFIASFICLLLASINPVIDINIIIIM